MFQDPERAASTLSLNPQRSPLQNSWGCHLRPAAARWTLSKYAYLISILCEHKTWRFQVVKYVSSLFFFSHTKLAKLKCLGCFLKPPMTALLHTVTTIQGENNVAKIFAYPLELCFIIGWNIIWSTVLRESFKLSQLRNLNKLFQFWLLLGQKFVTLFVVF